MGATGSGADGLSAWWRHAAILVMIIGLFYYVKSR